PDRLAQASERVDRLAARARPSTRPVGHEAALRAAARAVRVTGDLSFVSAPRIVELRPVANIAAGEPEHTIAASVVREGEPVPDADVYVVRDVHRHPWMAAADRDGAVVVETGLPVWEPRLARAHVATFGNGRAALDAAARLLRPRVPA